MVFLSKQAIVIGPTPPGTGVSAFAFFETSSKCTSPTIPLSVLLMPTSMTITMAVKLQHWLQSATDQPSEDWSSNHHHYHQWRHRRHNMPPSLTWASRCRSAT